MFRHRLRSALRSPIRWAASLSIAAIDSWGMVASASPATASSLATPSSHAQSVARAAAMSTSAASLTGNALGYYSPAGAPSPHAEIVHVGMYAVNAYDIDTAANTFQCKFYVWFR